ncbi:MAG: hypothetical protein B5766_12705 [Candidatus Lumbricidophila eiseniae]|uniref:Bacterial type II secretion system protein E domain-containing protein n=1 Tax=Candidatus Lumbricidiphila eiseniae TaxID=1969409 RepID=A0A2A6FND0_9MICO|nr:MAG: hypothetical protein B5766_12705 [Candidatus Lumbricidophila eiseniae]
MVIPFVATPSWSVVPSQPTEPDGSGLSRQESVLGEEPVLPQQLSRATPAPLSRENISSGTSGARSSTLTSLSREDINLLGPLAPFALAGAVTDLFVNGAEGLWIDRGRGAERVPAWSADEGSVRALATQLIARGGRHIDEATPTVDVRLGGGIRVHAVLPPVSSRGTAVSIRVPRTDGFTLRALVESGMLSDDQRAFLTRSVRERKNFLITGAAGSGKTTLLAALLGEAAITERIVIIEDVAELRVMHPHVVSLEARQPNLEGTGRVGLDALLREALRMRPDRLVVGECRGVELRELLSALNTGHDGGAGTLHANSLADVPARLEALGSAAEMSAAAIARQTVSAFHVVLHVERRDGRRQLTQVGRFIECGDRLAVEVQ